MSENQSSKSFEHVQDHEIVLEIVKRNLLELSPNDHHERLGAIACKAATLGLWNEFKQEFGTDQAEDQIASLDDSGKLSMAAKFALGDHVQESTEMLDLIDDETVKRRAEDSVTENYAIAGNADKTKEFLDKVYDGRRQQIMGLLFNSLEMKGDYKAADKIRRTENIDLSLVFQSAENAIGRDTQDRFDDIFKFCIKNHKYGQIDEIGEIVREYVCQATVADKSDNSDDVFNYFNAALYFGNNFKWSYDINPQLVREWIHDGYINGLVELGEIGFALENVCIKENSEGSLRVLKAATNEEWTDVVEPVYGDEISSQVKRLLMRMAYISGDKDVAHIIADNLTEYILEDPQPEDYNAVVDVIMAALEDGDLDSARELYQNIQRRSGLDSVKMQIIEEVIQRGAYEDLDYFIGDDENLATHAHFTLDYLGNFKEADKLRAEFCEVFPTVFESDLLDSRINVAVSVHRDWALALKTAQELSMMNEGAEGYEILAVEALKTLAESKNAV